MPFSYDRVKDSTTSAGTGDITLSGSAPTSYQTFASRYAINQTLTYAIISQGGAEWETGEGYLSASTTLVRSSVADGSSGLNTPVNFSAGTKDVFVTPIGHFMMDVNSGAIDAKIRGLAMP